MSNQFAPLGVAHGFQLPTGGAVVALRSFLPHPAPHIARRALMPLRPAGEQARASMRQILRGCTAPFAMRSLAGHHAGLRDQAWLLRNGRAAVAIARLGVLGAAGPANNARNSRDTKRTVRVNSKVSTMQTCRPAPIFGCRSTDPHEPQGRRNRPRTPHTHTVTPTSLMRVRPLFRFE